jgi:hypothetical protein
MCCIISLLLQIKNCLLRFGSAESVQEFMALVEKNRPQA